MITKRVKSRKRKHKHHRENNTIQQIEPYNDAVSEPPRQGIKLFVCYFLCLIIMFNISYLKINRLNLYRVLVELKQHHLNYLLHHQ